MIKRSGIKKLRDVKHKQPKTKRNTSNFRGKKNMTHRKKQEKMGKESEDETTTAKGRVEKCTHTEVRCAMERRYVKAYG